MIVAQPMSRRAATWVMVKKIVPPVLQGFGIVWIVERFPEAWQFPLLLCLILPFVIWGVREARDVNKLVAEAQQRMDEMYRLMDDEARRMEEQGGDADA